MYGLLALDGGRVAFAGELDIPGHLVYAHRSHRCACLDYGWRCYCEAERYQVVKHLGFFTDDEGELHRKYQRLTARVYPGVARGRVYTATDQSLRYWGDDDDEFPF